MDTPTHHLDAARLGSLATLAALVAPAPRQPLYPDDRTYRLQAALATIWDLTAWLEDLAAEHDDDLRMAFLDIAREIAYGRIDAAQRDTMPPAGVLIAEANARIAHRDRSTLIAA